MKPGKKPTACSACHERKVRCDASLVGTPCSRCIARQVGNECRLMKRSRPVRNRDFIHHAVPQQASGFTTASDNHNNNAQQTPRRNTQFDGPSSHEPSEALGQPESTRSYLEGPSSASAGDQSVSEEDAQLRMYTYITGNALISPTAHSEDELHNTCELIEYRSELDHLSILCDAAAAQARPKIVRVTVRESIKSPNADEVGNPESTSPENSEEHNLRGYSEVDWRYLAAKDAFSLPSVAIRQDILKTYFEIVYPYAPILDRITFVDRCLSDDPPFMLLHAVIANVIPYAPMPTIKALGFSTRIAALKAFDQRATLLYDIPSSKPYSQLEMLQVSTLLGAIQFSLTADKDYRFWLHNAVRIATRMGLHRDDISDEVNAEELALWRRIWWVIYIRDVQVTMSGLLNVPIVGANYSQIPDLTLNDWQEKPVPPQYKGWLLPVTRTQKMYQVEMCKLAKIGASVLHILQGRDRDREAPELLLEAVERVRLQRRQFPPELSLAGVSTLWHTDYLWASLLSGYSCRVECVVFSELARLQKSANEQFDDTLQQRQQGAMFEFDVIVGRNLMWNSVNCFPLGFVMIVATMLASHIRLAVKGAYNSAGANLSYLYIPQDLQFLKRSQETWDCVTWRVRLFEKILGHYADTGVEVGYQSRLSQSQILPNNDPTLDPTGAFFALNRMDAFAPHGKSAAMGTEMFDTDLDAWLGAMVRSEDIDQIIPDTMMSNDFSWNL